MERMFENRAANFFSEVLKQFLEFYSKKMLFNICGKCCIINCNCMIHGMCTLLYEMSVLYLFNKRSGIK